MLKADDFRGSQPQVFMGSQPKRAEWQPEIFALVFSIANEDCKMSVFREGIAAISNHQA